MQIGGYDFGTGKGMGEAIGYGAATLATFGILPVVDMGTGGNIYKGIGSDLHPS